MRYRYYILLIFFCNSCFFTNSNNECIKLINDLKGNTIISQYKAKAYYYEYADTHNQDHLMSNEAVGYFISSGYKCIIPKDNFSFFPTNFRKCKPNDIWLAYLEKLYNESDIEFSSDFSPGYNSLFSEFRFFEDNGPIFSSDSYNLVLYSDSINSDIDIIKFKPVKDANESDKFSYYGSIYYNRNLDRIFKIQVDSSQRYSYQQRMWVKSNMEITYDVFNNKYFVSSLASTVNSNSFKHKIHLQIITDSLEYINVDDIDYKFFNIYDHNPFVFYDSSEWNNIHELALNINPKSSCYDDYNSTSFNYYLKKYPNKDFIDHSDIFKYVYKYSLHNSNISKIDVKEKYINLGIIEKDSIININYVIRNMSNIPLYIYEVRPDCQCTSFDLSKYIIHKNDSADLSLKFDAFQKLGYHKIHTILRSNTKDELTKLTFELTLK